MIELKLNPKNPRTISKDKFEKLVNSIREFPKMMDLRPIIYDDDLIILGGNMRYRALQELEKQGFEIKDSWFRKASDLNEDEKQRFVIEDNVAFGDWDWDILANEWADLPLDDWALDVPEIKETERLSELKYESIYYEPVEKPEIKLIDCINMDKFNAKIKALDEFNLTDEQKEVLKLFAYRFLKIDFENVANYYFFNASDEERKAIERLRLVLSDTSIKGFIEDGILNIYSNLDWNEEDD